MVVVAMFALSAIPDRWRSAGEDLIWAAGVLGSLTLIVTLLVKIRPLRKFPLWFWRRTWGRDEHGTWLTPTVRFARLMRGSVREDLSELSMRMERQVEAFREENAAQHQDTAGQLQRITERLDAQDKRNEELDRWRQSVDQRLANLPPS